MNLENMQVLAKYNCKGGFLMPTYKYRPQIESFPELCLGAVSEVDELSCSYKKKLGLKKLIVFTGMLGVKFSVLASGIEQTTSHVSPITKSLDDYKHMLPSDLYAFADLVIKLIKGLLISSVAVAIVLVIFELMKAMMEGHTGSILSIVTRYVGCVVAIFGVVILLVTVAKSFL